MPSIFEIADILPLTTENSIIRANGDFAELILLTDGAESSCGIIEAKRAFPFEAEEEYIILENEENKDIGFIRNLADRSKEEQEILRRELARRYYMPVITGIHKVTDRFGFSYWSVSTSGGETEFSVRDTYKSIIHLGNRMIITDADGNRFDIPDVNKLPGADRKKIELYLW